MSTTYINISEAWGDAIAVTADDYRDQAAIFGADISSIDEREDGIYIDGEQVAEPIDA